MSKIHSESKSQQVGLISRKNQHCVSLCQRYILKANHNIYYGGGVKGITVSHYVKDTFWKQITTNSVLCIRWCQLCLTMSKIHSESKSQQLVYISPFSLTVSHYVKDTFWKQITTSSYNLFRSDKLCLTMSKIHSESKSQHSLSQSV